MKDSLYISFIVLKTLYLSLVLYQSKRFEELKNKNFNIEIISELPTEDDRLQ